MRRLSELSPGERGRVARVGGAGPVAERLAAMGITPGAVVEVVRRAPLGDPVDVLVRGYHLSLRKSEASLVVVEEDERGAPHGA